MDTRVLNVLKTTYVVIHAKGNSLHLLTPSSPSTLLLPSPLATSSLFSKSLMMERGHVRKRNVCKYVQLGLRAGLQEKKLYWGNNN